MALLKFFEGVFVLLIHFFDGLIVFFGHFAMFLVDTIEGADSLKDAEADGDNHSNGDENNNDAMDGDDLTEEGHGRGEIEVLAEITSFVNFIFDNKVAAAGFTVSIMFAGFEL